MWTAKPSASSSEVPEQHRGLTIPDLESMVTVAFAHASNFEPIVVTPLAIASMMTEAKS